jgi:hypothetical protein
MTTRPLGSDAVSVFVMNNSPEYNAWEKAQTEARWAREAQQDEDAMDRWAALRNGYLSLGEMTEGELLNYQMENDCLPFVPWLDGTLVI